MESHPDSDVALARALIEGRLEAFDLFVEHFRTRVFQYSYLMCGHREDAEEVAQDTLLKVFENFTALREPEKVRSWVFRIAKNACLMKRRRSVFAPDHEMSLEQYMREPGTDGGLRVGLCGYGAAHGRYLDAWQGAGRSVAALYP